MTTPIPSLDQTIARMKREILTDIASGALPRQINSFSHLHDFVDANCYGGFCEGLYNALIDHFGGLVDECMPEAMVDYTNAAQNAIDVWIKAGLAEDELPAAVSQDLVRRLRADTGFGLMECKRALLKNKGVFYPCERFVPHNLGSKIMLTAATREEILMSLARLLGDVKAMDAAGKRKELWLPNAGTKARIAEARDILMRETVARLEEADRLQKEKDRLKIEITAELVQKLRERTGLGLMQCKKALIDCEGDIETAYQMMSTGHKIPTQGN